MLKIFFKSTKPIYQPEEINISLSKEEFKRIIIKNIFKRSEHPIVENREGLKITIYNQKIKWMTQRRYIILECNKMTAKVYEDTNKLINNFIKDIKFDNCCRGENLTLIVIVEEYNNLLKEFLKNTSVLLLYGLRATNTLSYPVIKVVYCNDKNKVYIGGCDCNIVSEKCYKNRVKKTKNLIFKMNK